MLQQRTSLPGVIILVILLSIATGIILVANSPSTIAYSMVNTGDMGLSKLFNQYSGSIVIYNLDEIERYGEGYVLILARSKPVSDVSKLNAFVERGGVIIAYGSPDHVISLLNALGVNAVFTGYAMSGGLYHIDPYFMPVDLYGEEYVFYRSFIGSLPRDRDETIIARSKYISFIDLNNNGLYDIGEPIGIYPLGLEIKVGYGRYIVLLAEGFLENAFLNWNNAFLEKEVRIETKRLIIDQSEHVSNILEYLRLVMSVRMNPIFIYLSMGIIVVLSMVSYYVHKER